MNLIAGILERGMTDKDAYEAAGVAETTFNRWKAAGKKAAAKQARGETLTSNEAALWEFWKAVKRGKAKGKALLVGLIMDAAQKRDQPKAWVAAAWLLERMHPKEFGRRYIKIDVGDAAGGDGIPDADNAGIEVTVNIQGTGKAPDGPPPSTPPATPPQKP